MYPDQRLQFLFIIPYEMVAYIGVACSSKEILGRGRLEFVNSIQFWKEAVESR